MLYREVKQDSVIFLANVTTESMSTLSSMLEGGNKHVACESLLILRHSDICSHGMVHSLNDFNFSLPIATQHVPQTLLAVVPKGTAPDAWVYIESGSTIQMTSRQR